MSQRVLDAYLDDAAATAEHPFGNASDGTVKHPLVRAGALEARGFQVALAREAVDASLLVVLPTGLGKTAIAALAAAERLHREPRAQVVVVAPTRPLVRQHAAFLRDALAVPASAVIALTGDDAPPDRAHRFVDARVIVATPHALANDAREGRISLSRVALLVVDEAHRAVGKYPFVPLAARYRAERDAGAARVLALTASPGAHRPRVTAVMENLGIERVEARDRADDDVRAFVKPLAVVERRVDAGADVDAARAEIVTLLDERVKKLKPFIPRKNPDARVGKKALVDAGDVIRARVARAAAHRRGYYFAAMLHQGVALLGAHALEVLETQGLAPFRKYVERLAAREEHSRAQKTFLNNTHVRAALAIAHRAPLSHPKEAALMDALEAQFAAKPESLVLVFAQYRDTIAHLVTRLRAEGFPVARFVGQADRGDADPGLSQDAQADVLDAFKRGDARVLVATSVAEEGLHVPSVDLVVFYEPVPSEIRAIQRRGRTGRDHVGRVLVLVTEDTRDVTAWEAAASREDAMHALVRGMKNGAEA